MWRNYHTWQSGQEVRRRFADKAPDRKFAALRHCRDGGMNTSIDRSLMHVQTHMHVLATHKMDTLQTGVWVQPNQESMNLSKICKKNLRSHEMINRNKNMFCLWFFYFFCSLIFDFFNYIIVFDFINSFQASNNSKIIKLKLFTILAACNLSRFRFSTKVRNKVLFKKQNSKIKKELKLRICQINHLFVCFI